MRHSDCVMPINRASHHASDSSGNDDGKADTNPSDGAAGKKDLGPSTVTLSGLLNAIDGVSSQVSSAHWYEEVSDTCRKTLFFSPQRISRIS
jgi:hypothetical protein